MRDKREPSGPQRRLWLLLDPREQSEGATSLPFCSDWHGAPVTGLDVVASEGGTKGQNACGWMGNGGDGWVMGGRVAR